MLGIALIGADRGDVYSARRCRQWMRLQPYCAGARTWVDTDLLPPCGLITAAMNLAVMTKTFYLGVEVLYSQLHSATSGCATLTSGS